MTESAPTTDPASTARAAPDPAYWWLLAAVAATAFIGAVLGVQIAKGDLITSPTLRNLLIGALVVVWVAYVVRSAERRVMCALAASQPGERYAQGYLDALQHRPLPEQVPLRSVK